MRYSTVKRLRGSDLYLTSAATCKAHLSFIKTSYTRNIKELATKPFGDVG